MKDVDRGLRIMVVGAGYVGLPLAIAAAQVGHEVFVYDKDPARINALRSGLSYIGDVQQTDVYRQIEAGALLPTTDPTDARHVGVVIFCLPTPLSKTGEPDVSHVLDAAKDVLPALVMEDDPPLIILESTVFPGFTRDVFLPRITSLLITSRLHGARGGKDFFLAFSPERTDPGNKAFALHNTPKVIGGLTRDCIEEACAFYRSFVDSVKVVSTLEVAEMVKLHENTFRAVNIGLVNELSFICQRLSIPTREVVDAAATKPFGFMPFYPGPGLGGHCIPVDPLYLSWRMRAAHYRTRFIDLAVEVNAAMPERVFNLVVEALNSISKPVRGAVVQLYGLTYKENVADIRESPAFEVADRLGLAGAEVTAVDPMLKQGEMYSLGTSDYVTVMQPKPCDCAVILAAHAQLPRPRDVLELAKVIVDTRGYVGSVANRVWQL